MYAINVLLLSTSAYSNRFFGSTFNFLESRKFLNYYFLQSRILGKYLYFLQSNKVIYFWQHWYCANNELQKIQKLSQILKPQLMSSCCVIINKSWPQQGLSDMIWLQSMSLFASHWDTLFMCSMIMSMCMESY